MWPLIFSATQRTLLPEERAELRRLADLVRRGVPGREAFNQAAHTLCQALDHCGLFGATHQPALTEPLLREVDELRGMLE